jgi:hypothetical protein
MTDFGSYSDAAAETCGFYSGLLGAMLDTPGNSAPGIRNPHLYAKGSGLVAGSAFTTTDKFHFHLGCPISVPHDLMRVNHSPPPWAPDPTPYLIYEDGYAAGDTLVAIYNEYTGGGKVVHLCFDLAAMVDSSSVTCAKAFYRGRLELMSDVVGNLFGTVPLCGYARSIEVDTASQGAKLAFSLSQNYPNPFNPDTFVEFTLPRSDRVRVKIYNVEGRLVKTLIDEVLRPGTHRIHWDGMNDLGQAVSVGMYFCRMEAGEFRATRKMVMLK